MRYTLFFPLAALLLIARKDPLIVQHEPTVGDVFIDNEALRAAIVFLGETGLSTGGELIDAWPSAVELDARWELDRARSFVLMPRLVEALAVDSRESLIVVAVGRYRQQLDGAEDFGYVVYAYQLFENMSAFDTPEDVRTYVDGLPRLDELTITQLGTDESDLEIEEPDPTP